MADSREKSDRAATTCPSCGRDRKEASELKVGRRDGVVCPCGYVFEVQRRTEGTEARR